MKLLLDTQAFLWYAQGNPLLGPTADGLLKDASNELHVSIVSLWELAIKTGINKLKLSVDYWVLIRSAIDGYGILVDAVTQEDCRAYAQLAFPNSRHRDPFDRMIVVQAQQCGLTVVGCDTAFDLYGISRLW